MCGPSQPIEAPSGAMDAVAMLQAGLTFLATADVVSLPAAVQGDCLRELGRAESMHTAAHASMLSAFTACRGFEEDGHGSTKTWLRWQASITGGAAARAMSWMRRLAAHPAVRVALASGDISASWARQICEWTDLLPEASRADGDAILLAAASGGAELSDLAALAEEMRKRTARPDADGGDDGFTDRWVRLETTFRGAGRLEGDLTPACAAALAAVLESLGKKHGPEDVRTRRQRDHDALEEACRRLVAAGGLPDVAGQPTHVQLHMSLAQLRSMPGAADAEAAWAAGRAAGDGEPGWVRDPKAATAYACDAQIAPIVTGRLDRAALATMTASYLRGGEHGSGQDGEPRRPSSPRTLRRLQDTLLIYAADVLSGPAGLAAFLRTGLLAAEFPPAMSLPLDVGPAVSTVPSHLRRAVIARDRHCCFPGCRQRPAACQVHHLIPRSEGGATALGNLTLLCPFHHLIAIHRWGWTLALNGDGTTTATSPDRRKTVHSHGPPEAAAA